MAARKHLTNPEVVRQTIRTTQLVKRLMGHIFKSVPMSKTQVSAAMGLLRKTMPDLSMVEYKDIAEHNASDLTTDELDQRIRALEGKAITPAIEPIAPELH